MLVDRNLNVGVLFSASMKKRKPAGQSFTHHIQLFFCTDCKYLVPMKKHTKKKLLILFSIKIWYTTKKVYVLRTTDYNMPSLSNNLIAILLLTIKLYEITDNEEIGYHTK